MQIFSIKTKRKQVKYPIAINKIKSKLKLKRSSFLSVKHYDLQSWLRQCLQLHCGPSKDCFPNLAKIRSHDLKESAKENEESLCKDQAQSYISLRHFFGD